MAVVCQERTRARERELCRPLSREEAVRLAETVWRDWGAIEADDIRRSFVRIARAIGRSDLTCPKSWRHTFATLLQDANVDPLIRSSDFSAPGGGLLVVVFDESFDSDRDGGGGHIVWVVVGPNVKKGFTSTSCYQHQSTLRFMSEALGLTSFPGEAASAPGMREFLASN